MKRMLPFGLLLAIVAGLAVYFVLFNGEAEGPVVVGAGSGKSEDGTIVEPSLAVVRPPKVSTQVDPVAGIVDTVGDVEPVRAATSVTGPLPPDIAAEEFTAADMVGLGDAKVDIKFGDYQAAVGEAFDVKISVFSPALMNFSLLMTYDPERLEYVASSAEALSGGFRYGVEFYANAEQKRMILISSGNPGAKVLDRSVGQPIARFRLRGLKPGNADLKFLAEGIKLLSGEGKPLPFEISGGRISIE